MTQQELELAKKSMGALRLEIPDAVWRGHEEALRPLFALAEKAVDAETQVEDLRGAIGEAQTITRGGVVSMPKVHWDRIGVALKGTE
jgi:hypothetical protein